MKREGKELEQELKNGIVDYESYLEKRNNYAEKMSDIGKSNLAEYVMHRKTILDILAQNIRYKDQEQQKYAYEKNIHQLIFPMTLFHSVPFAYYSIKTDSFDQPSLACSLISHLQPLILHNQ